MTAPELTAAGLRINRRRGLWGGRIIDSAVAQSLAIAGFDPIGLPASTSTCSTVAALASLQREPAQNIEEKNK